MIRTCDNRDLSDGLLPFVLKVNDRANNLDFSDGEASNKMTALMCYALWNAHEHFIFPYVCTIQLAI